MRSILRGLFDNQAGYRTGPVFDYKIIGCKIRLVKSFFQQALENGAMRSIETRGVSETLRVSCRASSTGNRVIEQVHLT
jgi:hypothetical protein